MTTVDATTFRKDMFSIMKSICNGEPMTIKHRGGYDCILVSKDEWSSLMETLYLMSNPKTRDDIINGINTPIEECVDSLSW